MHAQLVEDGRPERRAGRQLPRPGARSAAPDTSFVEQVRALGVSTSCWTRAWPSSPRWSRAAPPLVTDRVEIVADLKIARGLDYYTGTVFETRLAGYESLGSICSGGRYDALATDGRTTYPGVGISLGVSRVLVPLLGQGVVTADRSVPSAVLVPSSTRRRRADQRRLPSSCARNGVPCEVAAVGAEVRQADPVCRASRHPVRSVPRRRRVGRDQGHPQRRPGARRRRAPGRLPSRTCAPASPPTYPEEQQQ